jgi:hypothetical protein
MEAYVLQNDGSVAHSGNWYADVGRGGNTCCPETDHLSQRVTIPSGYTSATLAFYLHITTVFSSSPADWLRVKVYDASGTELATLATYTNVDATPDYVLHSLDMTPYIGQTVTIKFLGTNTSSTQTDWLLDDLTLTVQ